MMTERRETDPDRVGYSLANLREILFGCLEAASSGSVVEIGAFRGDLTRELLDWARRSGARITAIEPAPPDELLGIAAEHPELELVRETSHAALPRLPLADALIFDGDHNYFTLVEELRLVADRAGQGRLPLLLF